MLSWIHPYWRTTDQILSDLKADPLQNEGKVALITGANGGIGKETALALAKAGYKVILACRPSKKTDDAVTDIRARCGRLDSEADYVLTIPLDLSDLVSVKECAETFISMNLPLHCLINNAGVMMIPHYTETKDGFESQIGVNHLGHFYLTELLMPKLLQTAPARVINLASLGHVLANWTPMRPKFNMTMFPCPKEQYDWIWNYGISKLCNILHAGMLNKKHSSKGVKAFSVHPGCVCTDLARQTGFTDFGMRVAGRLFLKTPSQGASTSVYLALADDAVVAKFAGGFLADESLTWPKQVDETMEVPLYEQSQKLIREKGFKI
eukprot:GFYU01023268.1.p1 GENE.GFYU01023268.1~~GFYU01023268.1.p1  ORF type:complete len:323 (+),score=39.61 GFYU01023268.1:46-1014(+)